MLPGVRAFKAPGKRQKAAASRQNSDVRLMGPPPPVLMIDGLPNGASGNLAAIRVHAPSPLGYLPAKESCSGPAVPVKSPSSHTSIDNLSIYRNFITIGYLVYNIQQRC